MASLQSKMSTEERRWQVENAMSTLKRAEEIKSDRKLMSEVKKSAAGLMNVVERAGKPISKKTTLRRK